VTASAELGCHDEVVRGKRCSEVGPGEHLGARHDNALIELVVTASRRRTPDENADLLEDLADSGHCVGQLAGAVAPVERPAGEDEGVRSETAPVRATQHADLDTTLDVAQQRDRTGGRELVSGAITHRIQRTKNGVRPVAH